MKKLVLIIPALAGTLLAGVVGLSKSAPVPHSAVLETVQAARDNDLGRFLEVALTDEEYSELKASWDEARTRELDPSEEFGFQVALQMVTAEGAEEILFAQLEPKLVELSDQAEALSGMVMGLAHAQIDQEASLTVDQREDASLVLEGLGDILTSGRLTDPAVAKQAIGVLCKTVRSLEVETLDELRALEFDAMLEKGGTCLAGVKEILHFYGADVDAWLETVQATTVRSDAESATVRVSYEIFGDVQESETELTFADGRWVGVRQ